MRRLLALVCSVLLVETVFFAALGPLLPGFEDRLGLAKWQAGLLVGTYALGGLGGAAPGAFVVTRRGVRVTLLVGLAGLAASSVVFGIVDSYWALVVARFAQGVAGAMCWTASLAWLVSAAPRGKRGELIGIAMSAAIGGALLGPLLGAAAAHFGRAAALSGIAVLSVALAAWCAATPPPPTEERQPVRMLLLAVRSRQVLTGMWMLAIAALLFGTLSVLGPLRLDEVGWGVLGIAITFVVSTGLEAIASPLIGRWSDRSGRFAPMRIGLVASGALCLVLPWVGDRWSLSVVIVAAGVAFGTFWAPSMALLSDGWEHVGVSHGLGFALMNAAWAPGNVFGSAVGGAIAGAAGDAVAYGALALFCAATLLALRARGHALVVPEVEPG